MNLEQFSLTLHVGGHCHREISPLICYDRNLRHERVNSLIPWT